MESVSYFKSSLKSWWTYEFIGAFFLLIGLLVLASPATSYASMVEYFVVTFLVSGVLRVMTAVGNRTQMRHWNWYAFGGAVDCLLGIFLYNRMSIASTVLVFYLGFFILFGGISMLFKAWDLRSLEIPNWEWIWVAGTSNVGLASFIVLNPILGAGLTASWASLGFFILGAFYIWLGYHLRLLSSEMGLNHSVQVRF